MPGPTHVLYSFPVVPNPQKAILALQEFHVDYVLRTVNIIAGQSLAPDFLKINANGTVPALVVEGKQPQIITESKYIVLYAAFLAERDHSVDPALVDGWVADVAAWNGPLFTLANDAVLKRIILSVNAYKTNLAKAWQRQCPVYKDAYANKIAYYRKAGKALANSILLSASLYVCSFYDSSALTLSRVLISQAG